MNNPTLCTDIHSPPISITQVSQMIITIWCMLALTPAINEGKGEEDMCTINDRGTEDARLKSERKIFGIKGALMK